MGKSSNFERHPRDYYPTPYEAVLPLLAKLHPRSTFIEPCAGDGRLVRHLTKHAHKCLYASDLEPAADTGGVKIHTRDALFFDGPFPSADMMITNPPWARDVLHPMIDKFRQQMPTWLLLDAGWAYTAQAKPYLIYCEKIVAVGRISWLENGTSSLDDCAWYLFNNYENQGYSRFYGK